MSDPKGTLLLHDPIFERHNTGPTHPESPARLRAVGDALTAAGLVESCDLAPLRKATTEEITRVHTNELVELVKGAAGSHLDPDTPVGAESYETALTAAGSIIDVAIDVWNGRHSNACCLIRPPGHHAEPDRAMGFCLFNNIALTAASLIHRVPDARILIIDFDAHHGNGTQVAFYEDPGIFYFSCHQWPFYPGTGAESETGDGKGQGTTKNAPLEAFWGDKPFLKAIDGLLNSDALDFDPHIVLISAGFDAHRDDPLAHLRVTTEGFGVATQLITDFAASECLGKVVSVLEGGYDLHALAESVVVHLGGLVESA